MGRSKKHSLPFDKRGGVLVTQRVLLASKAWGQLSSQAKCLMPLLQSHWRHDKPVAYGVREAMQRIPCAKGTAAKAFKQLQSSGFIVMVDESWFDSRTKSKTRTWRLTWLPWQGKSPTNEWEKLSQPGQKCTL